LILDVGCGNERLAKGTVNVDFFSKGKNLQIGNQLEGEYVNPKHIPNFILADACHLPFKDKSFKLAISSHVIEHVATPFLMFKEMHRVSEGSVVIRCPHRRGSGAKRPFHINYLDEAWFKQAANKLNVESEQFVSCYDSLVTSKVSRGILKNTLPMRLLKHIERRWFGSKLGVPFELESWSNFKVQTQRNKLYNFHFVVVSNNQEILTNCFMRGVPVTKQNTTIYQNKNHTSLPTFFNKYIDDLKEDTWIAFCHQDFILKQYLPDNLNVNAVYGVIGVRPNVSGLFGRIQQTDGSYIGRRLWQPAPVQTLDEMCIMVHSSLFRKGLRFDENLPFDFYGADLCLQAFSKGFGVYALQLACQHKSLSIHGGTEAEHFKKAHRIFGEKWKAFVPIRTTSAWVDNVDHEAILSTLKKRFLVG
jgi:SAM-dependent methyltransferase